VDPTFYSAGKYSLHFHETVNMLDGTELCRLSHSQMLSDHSKSGRTLQTSPDPVLDIL